MAHRTLTDRRALVTGASSGIGRALAIELARHGVDVVLLARREDRLAEVADEIRKLGRRAVTVAGDVTDRGRCAAAHSTRPATNWAGSTSSSITRASAHMADLRTPTRAGCGRSWK